MSVLTTQYTHDVEYKLLMAETQPVFCIENNLLEHEFAGIVQDIETAVDLNNKRRIAALDEEDDTDTCLADLNKFRQQLTITCTLHNSSHIIFTLSTPWIYTDPQHDIVSHRRQFYVLFNIASCVFNKTHIFTSFVHNVAALTNHSDKSSSSPAAS